MVAGDKTESDCRGIVKNMVPDIAQLQVTKKTGSPRKRSRSSMSTANVPLLEQSGGDGNNKKRKSVESGCTGRNDATQKVTIHVMCMHVCTKSPMCYVLRTN